MSEPRIYHNEQHDTFSVADDGGWYPGIYATTEAARFAPQVWTVLAERTHWRVRGVGDAYRPVTLGELQAWAAELESRGGNLG